MSMAQEIDYSTLKWVKDEIDESLKQTRQALEAYVENPEDKTQIRFCATYLHQIYGTLQMVEIYGGALLAEEMESLCNAILADKITQKDEAYDVLMRAILQLPSYLEHIERGEPDQPVILLPLLNDLRSVRGDHLLSDNAFFTPDLAVEPPSEPAKVEKKLPEVKQYAKKLRTLYQASLVGIYRDNNVKGNLKKIGAVCRELMNMSTNNHAKRLWWVASGLVEALLDSGIDMSNAVKQVIGQLDKHIKEVIAKGEQAFAETPTELLKSILYYIATAKSSGKRVTQIKKAFNLENLLPNSTDIDEAYDNLRGSTQDLMKTVSAVIKEDLLHVKDQLDIFVRSSDRAAQQLKPLEDQLSRIADTLAMLGLGDLRKIIQDQINNIENMMISGESPNDIALMEIASSLLYIESSLEGVETTKLVSDEEGEKDGVLPPAEQKQLSKQVITESADVLSKVKESFNTFANDPTQFSIIANTPEYLTQVRGVLGMLSYDRASTLLHSAISYIANEILKKQTEPNQAALDAIADVITSIEYYLEAITEERLHPESLLAVAEQSLTKLGYLITETDEGGNVTSAVPVQPPTEISFEPAPELELVNEPAALELEIPNEAGMVLEEAQPLVEDKAIMEQAVAPEVPLEKEATGANVLTSVKQQLVDDIDEEILEIFIEEADEVLVVMKENLAAWQANQDDNDALTILRRSYHTIKGSGRLAGATIVGEFAWAVENMLNRVIDKKIQTSSQLFAVMDQAQIALEGLIKQLKNEAETAIDPQPLAEIADAIANGEVVTAVVTPFSPQYTSAAQPVSTEEIAAAQEIAIEEAPTEMVELVEVPTQESALEDVFKKETATHLQSIQDYLGTYADQEHRLVNEPLMRALHTLHGSARMAESTHIATLSEALDRYFRTLHDSEQQISDAAVEVLREGAQTIANMSAHNDESYQPDNLTALLEKITDLHNSAKAAQVVKESGAFSLHDEKADAELVSIFMEEAADILSQIDNALGRWKKAIDDLTIIDEVQRSLHTLKGGARMANVKPVADLSHHLETALEQVVEGKRQPEMDLHNLSLKVYDRLAQALDHLYMGQNIKTSEDVIEEIKRYVASLPEEPAPQALETETPIAELETLEISALQEAKTMELQEQEIEQPPEAQEPEFTERPTEEISIAELDQELVDIFLEEADELRENIENTLDRWHGELNNLDHISELQRALHTLKGGARMAGITAIADVSHAVESTLEQISEKLISPDNSHPQLVQRSLDWLSHAIEAVKNNNLPIFVDNDLLADLEAATKVGQPAADFEEIMQEPEAIEEISLSEPASIELEEISLEEPAVELEEISLEEPEAIGLEEISLQESEVVAEEPAESAEIIQLEEAQFTVPDFAQEIATKVRSEAKAKDHEAEEYDEELVDIFLEEAVEIQENSDKTIHQWVTDVNNRELIAELQRALHTLKGGARMAGIKPIGDLSHAIESLLEAVTEGHMQPTVEYPRVVQACHDWLSQAIDHVKHNEFIEPANYLISQLENLLSGKPAKHGLEEMVAPAPQAAPKPLEIPEPEVATEEFAQPAEIRDFVELTDVEQNIPQEIAERLGQTALRTADEQVRVRADLIDNLVNYAGEANIYNARIEQQLNAWQFNLTELKQTVQRLREQLRKFEIETEAQIMYRHTEITEGDEQFDPLELDRFSYMQQLSRGMVESLGDLTSIQDLLETVTGEADVLLLQQSRVNNDLQEGLMRTRLTPFSSILARLRRIVRQTCEETGKEAGLNVVGAEGEMDRTQLNRIVPALEHILRNAVDHGLESPAERSKAGKTPEGHIEIRFTREGSEVVLRISDDGAGINIDALRQKAVERGLINQNTKISDNELTEFILQSGFSTAKSVTQISGRGVGMDVVSTEIKQLNGSLHIETKQGEGTTFIVRLPLTVVINQALMVKINEAIYAIQMSNIEHVVRVRGDTLNQLISGEMQQYDYAGHQYDALNLTLLLNGVKSATVEPKATFPLLLGRSGDHRVAMQVDELVGRQEIVIKSLGPQLSTVSNISGATILPDGSVALILDISTLIRRNMAIGQAVVMGEQIAVEAPITAPEEEKRPVVMIVDDSITVRKVTQRLLDRHNFDTLTAKDGVDALTLLLEQIPDIMLLDIEMPRMDGFELATAVRNDERLKHVPIIMITSRTGEKHRDRALNIGVNMYLGKPFQEHELLENIQNLLNNQ